MNTFIYALVILGNTLVILGALAACCYLTINNHVGMAIACLFLPLVTLTSIKNNNDK